MFQKRHYEVIAAILKEGKEGLQDGIPAIHVMENIDERFAEFFAGDNSRFDYDRFIKACQ